jgi:Flp pilus assembly pilin Flp
MRGLFKLLGDQRGVGTIEYALIASLISIAAFTAMVDLGGQVDKRYDAVDTAVADAM